MDKIAQQLLELHIQHELKKFSDEQFQIDLQLELKEFWQQLTNTKLYDVISPEQVIKWVQQNIIETDLHANVTKLVSKIVTDLCLATSHKENSLSTVITRDQVEAFIDKALTQKTLRQEIIRQGMSNDITHEVITELLYSGIANYLTESNVVVQKAQKVPGAKAMIKMSKSLMSKGAPKLENKIETQIKKYISTALPDVIAQSENFIYDSITDAHIKEISMKIWDKMQDSTISNAFDYINTEDIQDYTQLIYQQFLSSRQSTYIKELVTTGINSFFKVYGNKNLDILCKDFSINTSRLEEGSLLFAPSILKILRNSDYLEQRIRARLENFYNSDSAQAIFS